MKKFILLITVLCAFSITSLGQEIPKRQIKKERTVVMSHFMVEIGLSSGFSDEQRLGSHFSLLGRVGLETMLWATPPDEIVFQGIYPSFRLSSRWYHSGKKRVGNINTGGYVSLEMGYVTGEWGGLFAKRLDGYSYNYSINIFQPTWGYNWAFNEHWGLKF